MIILNKYQNQHIIQLIKNNKRTLPTRDAQCCSEYIIFILTHFTYISQNKGINYITSKEG